MTLSPTFKKIGGLSTSRETLSPEKRQWVRAQSAQLLARNLMKRDQARETLEFERTEKFHIYQDRREEYLRRWTEKTKRSPFGTDLVAESERIAEETRGRKREEDTRRKIVLSCREKAKNDIVLTALSEYSDLEALRQEKRAILDEEQRIMALLAIEKTSHQNKGDRIVAERALKQRQIAKTSYRRQNYKESLDRVQQEELLALRAKHGLEPIEILHSLQSRSLSSTASASRSKMHSSSTNNSSFH